MKNKDKIESLTFSMLVMPYEDGYLAMCKETGLVRSGTTLEEARDVLVSAMVTLVEAVSKNEELVPSLSVGLPLRYRVLFNWTVTKILTRFAVNRFLYQTQPLKDFSPRFA